MKKTGDEYFDSEEFQEMLAEYEEAVNTGQPVFLDADELAEIADYYQMVEQPDDAEAAISLAEGLSPGACAPLTYRIHEALYDGDTERAREFLEQITEKDAPEYTYNYAEILLAEGNADEADDYLREQFKSIPPEEYQDFVVDVANLFSDYDQNDKALQWMARAQQEDTPDFKELMGRTLFGLGKYKDSQRFFNELIDTDPFSKQYWNALASAQYMDEDYQNSIQSSEYAIAIDPEDPDGLASKANGLFKLGNYEEALKYYKRYAEQEPDDEIAYLHQGSCLINLGMNEEAVEILEYALEVAGERDQFLPDIYQELAFAYSEMQQHEKALECLDHTDQMECDHVQIDVVKGHILLASGRTEEAEFFFKKAVNDSAEPNQTLLRVIVSIYDNRYVEAAYNLLRKFLTAVPKDFNEGYAYMALCCYDLKKHDEFLSFLKKACLVNPKECKLVLQHLFPENVEPEDYYKYFKENDNK